MFEFPEQPTQHKIKQNPEPIPQLKNQKKKPFTLNHSSIIDNPPKLHTPQEQTPRTWHQIHPNHKKVRTLPTPEANHRQKGITKNRERERVTSQSMRIEEVSERKKKWKERIRVGRRAMILITLTSHQRRGLWFFFVWFVKEFYFIFLKKGRASPKVRLSLSGTGTNKQGEDE